MRLFSALLIVVASVSCCAEDAPKIILPMETVAPAESPQPIKEIGIDRLYIVQGPQPIYFRQVPDGFVKITDLRAALPAELQSSPVVLHAIFSDGPGTREIRVFASAFVYTVEPVRVGNTTLVIIPAGGTDADIKLQPLKVTGTAPNPPPPDPIPDPDPVPTAKHVRLSVITDSENTSLSVATVLNGLVAWNELLDGGSEYRLYDIATTEPEGKKAIEQLNGIAPGIVITNKDTGALIHHGPLPATFVELKLLVGSVTDG